MLSLPPSVRVFVDLDTGASYPGPEGVWAVEGLFRYEDVCDSTGVVAKTFEIFYGGITERGFQVLPDRAVLLTDNFVDLANNYSVPTSGPHTLPISGKVAPTTTSSTSTTERCRGTRLSSAPD